MSNEVSATPECTIDVAMLFKRINKGRNMRLLQPVENSAIASRCNLRFNIGRNERVDFTQEQVVLSDEDINALEHLLNEQFDCGLEGDVKKLCVPRAAAKPTAPKPAPTVAPPQPTTTQATADTDKDAGLMSKIKKVFGNK